MYNSEISVEEVEHALKIEPEEGRWARRHCV